MTQNSLFSAQNCMRIFFQKINNDVVKKTLKILQNYFAPLFSIPSVKYKNIKLQYKYNLIFTSYCRP